MKLLPSTKEFLEKSFPVPSFLQMSAPGIEIGTDEVAFFAWREEKGMVVPSIFDHIKLSNKCEVGSIESPLDCPELIETLTSLAKKHQINEANITIPESEVYVFSTTIYLEEGQAIEAALISQIEKNVPFSPDDVTYDYEIIRQKGNAVLISVAAVSKQVIRTYEEILQQAGITPLRAIGENQAVVNALVPLGDPIPHIVVHVSPERAIFSICEKGIVELTSEIIFSENFTGDMQKNDMTVKAIQKKISQILMHWYSTKGKAQQEKIHHMLVYSFNSDVTHDLMVQLKKFFPHLVFHSATPWENMFNLDEYLPEITKDESFLFVKAIGASLVGKKI